MKNPRKEKKDKDTEQRNIIKKTGEQKEHRLKINGKTKFKKHKEKTHNNLKNNIAGTQRKTIEKTKQRTPLNNPRGDEKGIS